MWLLLGTVGYAIASALIPVFNAEAYVVLLVDQRQAPGWALVTAAALGQMLGKLLWYYLGEKLTVIPWFRRKFEQPKWRDSLDKWHARTEGKPVLTGLILFVSSFTGLPPFALIAVLAGLLRFNVVMFVIAGFIGRWLRFFVILEAAELAWWAL